MKSFTFPAVLLLTCVIGNSQNLIGYKAKEITDYMIVNRSDMNRDRVNNKSFRYLKYSDKYDSQTILYFLDRDSVCRNIRIVCNNNIRGSKIRELDSLYLKTGEKSWVDKRSGKNYLVRLIDEEWSFSVTIEPEK